MVDYILKKPKDKMSILVEFFIKKPVNWDTKRFRQECVASARLIKKYPDFDFFYHLPDLVEKFNSLFGLLMQKNVEMLDRRYREFVNTSKPEVAPVVSDIPLIEIKPQESKPKSIRDFLNS